MRFYLLLFSLLVLPIFTQANVNDLNPSPKSDLLLPEGGTLTTADGATELSICAGDGISDSFGVILENASGEAMIWLITDTDGIILATPIGPLFDLEGAGDGICLLQNLSYDGGIDGLAVGENIADLVGDFSFSNPITITRTGVTGGTLLTMDGGFSIETCEGDGESDAFDVSLTGNSGANSAWVITDNNLNILMLPAGPPFDFEGSGGGICKLWNISYGDGLTGLEVGQNVVNLDGCYDLSSEITVNRKAVNGGLLTTLSGDTEIITCPGDGQSDAFSILLNGQQGTNSHWVITDPIGNILGLPESPPFEFEDAGFGVCQLWYLAYHDEITNVAVGNNISEISGCYQFSNPITVNRNGNGGEIETTDGLTELTICVDGISDAFDVNLTGEQGSNSAWIITDQNLTILDLPTAPPFDLDGAGVGVCLIWHLSFEDGLLGAEIGENANDLFGCFGLSNPITVTRTTAVGGELEISDGSLSIDICAGDGISDAFDVNLTNNEGDNSRWVITDTDGNILGLPAAPPFDLEGAGGGTCLIWHISYGNGTTGIAVGNNANTDINGCYELSNSITVNRTGVSGGELSTSDGETELIICAGDGMSDAFDVNLINTEGANSAWVITDTDGTILGLPAGPPFDLEGAGLGVCQIWHLSYADGLTGATMGANANDLVGCFDLSNPITVTRTFSVGGNLTIDDGSSSIDICAGDGSSDAFDVTLMGNEGQNSGWVITDSDGVILGLPAGPPFDLEGAGSGTCLIWHISYADGTPGLEVGNNANTAISGCYELSNPITVNRTGVAGGDITTTAGETNLTICAGDGISDAFEVNLTNSTGANSAWVITDTGLNILDLPAGPPFDLEGAGAGTCLIWHLSFEDGLTGAEVGENATNLAGCFSLSNPITVVRTSSVGGTLATADGETAIEICAGDGNSDAFDITLMGNEGQNSGWVITDTDGMILGLPAAPPFDLEGAGEGVCLIWHISFADGLTGALVGNNANTDLEGCYELSNSITVTRTEVAGGDLNIEGGATEISICAGDGISDEFNVELVDNIGANSAWVITDANGLILALPPAPPFDLEGAGEGVCLIWHLSYEDGLTGAEVDNNASELAGCFALSNPITVTRGVAEGGDIALTDGSTELSVCAGDGISDAFDVSLDGEVGQNSAWVITDQDGMILGLPAAPPIELEFAGEGVCLIWHLSYANGFTGAEIGNNANTDFEGCYDLSNPITATRTGVMGGSLATSDGETELTICAGDDISDAFDVNLDGAAGGNSAWVITDQDGLIIGLPAAPPFDLDGAGAGVCLLWHLSFADGLTGAEIDNNANTDLVGCFALSNPITVTRVSMGAPCTTGIEELPNASSFSIYPNPATQTVLVNFENESPVEVEVELVNTLGLTSLPKQYLGIDGSLELEISDLPAGVYFVKLRSAGKGLIKTLVVE